MGVVIGLEGTAHTAGVGIVAGDGTVLANESEMYRPPEGGIHPRKAADHHAAVFGDLILRALTSAGVRTDDIEAVAFSIGPGLGPCLRVTATAARAAALTLGVPLIGVNHCVAHLEIGRIVGSRDPILLYVSGGNTQVLAFVDGRYRVLGETLDIGIGNLLDKLGLAMGLRFPAAPRLEELARQGRRYVPLPYSVKGMDVAFSGILTAAQGSDLGPADLALSVQETAFAMLVEVTERAMAHTGKGEVLLGGGVAQNARLVEMVSIMCRERGAVVEVPPPGLLRDNGAMIAHSGLIMHRAGVHLPVRESHVRPRYRVDDVDVLWGGPPWDTAAETVEGGPALEGAVGFGRFVDPGEGRLLRIGAEAQVTARRWHGMPVVVKERVPKGYRHPALDREIRARRTRHEARMLREARSAGVRTPYVLDIDLERSAIVMEMLDAPTIRDILFEGDAPGAVEAFGSALGRLHRYGMTHGDPTTSNVIVAEGGLGLIDLSLGDVNADIEAMAVDLRLARETLESTHPGVDFDRFLAGYAGATDAGPVMERLMDLDSRGRYRIRPARS